MNELNNMNLNNKISLAKKAVRNNKLKDAYKCFENILKISPNNKFATQGIKKLNKIKLSSKNNDLKGYRYYYNKGDLIQCEEICKKELKDSNFFVDIYKYLSLSLIKQKKYDEALKVLQTSLSKLPNNLELLFLISNLQKQMGYILDSIKNFEVMLKISPSDTSILINLSECFNIIKKYEVAIKYCEKALKILPNSLEILCVIGNSYYGLGDFKKALHFYRKAIEIRITPNIIHNICLSNIKLNNFKEAKKLFEDNINRYQLLPETYIDYATCLVDLGNIEEGLSAYKLSIEKCPNDFRIYNNLGNLYSYLGKNIKALEAFKKALKLSVNNQEVYYNLALANYNDGAYNEAIHELNIALELNKEFYQAYNLLALCYQNKNELQKANDNFNLCINLKPDFYPAYFNFGLLCIKNGKNELAINLLNAAKELGCPYKELPYLINSANFSKLNEIDQDLDHFIDTINKKSTSKEFVSSYLLPLLYSDKITKKQIYDLHQKFDTRDKLPTPKKNKNEKIRIGYVSADFTGHSVGFFLEKLFENHDKIRFEIYCYFNSSMPDYKTKLFQELSCHWRNIFSKNDVDVYKLIIEDKIDILVDLSGHTAGNRLEVFRKKPAFKQISWLGYPATTGLKTIDYRFTDNIADPIEEDNKFHTEKLYRLNNSFLCYKNDAQVIIEEQKPVEKNKFITFGSFNNISKISKNNFETWIKILKKVPNSNIVLKSIQFSSDIIKSNVKEKFEKNDINPSRVKLFSRLNGLNTHLYLYNEIDIALDTFPYNGATTTFEALWMGVPVITLAGDRHVSRVSKSILQNLSLNDFIAYTPEEYIQKAFNFSKNIDHLKYLKLNLREKLNNSIICDGKSFTQNVERAYLDIFNEKN